MKKEGIYISCNDHRCINYWEQMCTPTLNEPEGKEINVIPENCTEHECKTRTCAECKEFGKSKCPMFKKGVSDWYEEKQEVGNDL